MNPLSQLVHGPRFSAKPVPAPVEQSAVADAKAAVSSAGDKAAKPVFFPPVIPLEAKDLKALTAEKQARIDQYLLDFLTGFEKTLDEGGIPLKDCFENTQARLYGIPFGLEFTDLHFDGGERTYILKGTVKSLPPRRLHSFIFYSDKPGTGIWLGYQKDGFTHDVSLQDRETGVTLRSRNRQVRQVAKRLSIKFYQILKDHSDAIKLKRKEEANNQKEQKRLGELQAAQAVIDTIEDNKGFQL